MRPTFNYATNVYQLYCFYVLTAYITYVKNAYQLYCFYVLYIFAIRNKLLKWSKFPFLSDTKSRALKWPWVCVCVLSDWIPGIKCSLAHWIEVDHAGLYVLSQYSYLANQRVANLAGNIFLFHSRRRAEIKELYTSISTLAEKFVLILHNNEFVLEILNSTPSRLKIRKHFPPKKA